MYSNNPVSNRRAAPAVGFVVDAHFEFKLGYLLSTSAKKLPLLQAGSGKRESIRSVSCLTESGIAFTSRSLVKNFSAICFTLFILYLFVGVVFFYQVVRCIKIN